MPLTNATSVIWQKKSVLRRSKKYLRADRSNSRTFSSELRFVLIDVGEVIAHSMRTKHRRLDVSIKYKYRNEDRKKMSLLPSASGRRLIASICPICRLSFRSFAESTDPTGRQGACTALSVAISAISLMSSGFALPIDKLPLRQDEIAHPKDYR